MDSSQVICDLYAHFQAERPENFTNFEHCDECDEHNETMKSFELEELRARHLGTAGWSPLSFLTGQAFEYCMPKFLELMVIEDKNEHGEPFAKNLLFHLAPTENDRFQHYSKAQCNAVLRVLQLVKKRHQESVVEYFIQNDLDQAIDYWQTRVK